jgi:hypothetical protein
MGAGSVTPRKLLKLNWFSNQLATPKEMPKTFRTDQAKSAQVI